MSGSTVTVNPGVAQQLTGAPISAGSTIYNQDSNNGVWLSSVQSVSPNNGMFLGALGTLEWTKGQVWACVDTGVTQPVQLTISDDVSNITNPVELGAAIAAKLLVTGVPNVLTEDTIYFGPQGNMTLDVSGYASLVIAPTGNGLNYEFQAPGAVIGPNNFIGLPTIVPVIGPSLAITAGSGIGNLLVIGSNRLPPLGREISAGFSSEGWIGSTGNIAMLAGQSYPLNASNDSVLFQGPCYAQAFITGTTVKGFWTMQTLLSNNVFNFMDTDKCSVFNTNEYRTNYFSAAIPANIDVNSGSGFSFKCFVAGTCDVSLGLVPAY